MKAVAKEELVPLIHEFVNTIAGIILISYGTTMGVLDAKGTLALWMQRPDCQLSPMFIGWVLAQDYNINSFSPAELEHAVQRALVGDNKTVLFDWLGDTDVNNKPH